MNCEQCYPESDLFLFDRKKTIYCLRKGSEIKKKYGSTFNAFFESSSPTFLSTTSVTSHEIPSSKLEPGQSNEGQAS